jgi:hypothetical protein
MCPKSLVTAGCVTLLAGLGTFLIAPERVAFIVGIGGYRSVRRVGIGVVGASWVKVVWHRLALPEPPNPIPTSPIGGTRICFCFNEGRISEVRSHNGHRWSRRFPSERTASRQRLALASTLAASITFNKTLPRKLTDNAPPPCPRLAPSNPPRRRNPRHLPVVPVHLRVTILELISARPSHASSGLSF